MLEYMEFKIGGYIGWETIQVIENDGKYTVKYQKALWEEWQTFEDINLDEWNDELERMHINKWHKLYIDYGILDGTEWLLEYKVKDKRCRHIHGSNAYPDNFDEFMQVLSVLYKIIGVPAFWEEDVIDDQED